MERVPVHFDHQTRGSPQEIDFEALEPNVARRFFDPGFPDQSKKSVFSLGANERGLVIFSQRGPEATRPRPARVSIQQRGQFSTTYEFAPVRPGNPMLEVLQGRVGGQIDECACRACDGDPQMVGDLVSRQRACSVEPHPGTQPAAPVGHDGGGPSSISNGDSAAGRTVSSFGAGGEWLWWCGRRNLASINPSVPLRQVCPRRPPQPPGRCPPHPPALCPPHPRAPCSPPRSWRPPCRPSRCLW